MTELTTQGVSQRVARALCASATDAASYYADVEHLVYPFKAPVLFWRKWFQTAGLRREGNDFTQIPLKSVAERDVVFVDRMATPNAYLLDGIEQAREYGADVIIVITHRLNFATSELEKLAGLALRVLVTHSYVTYEHAFEEHCPGIFMPMPHVN